MTISRNLRVAGLAAFSLSSSVAFAGDLTIYTPQSADRTAVIEELAEAKLGFDIDFVNMGGGEVYDRVLAERNNPQADVIFGLIDFLTAGLKQEGLLEKYTLDALDGLPDIYKDPDGYFYGYRQTPITLSYNTDILSGEEAPQTWEELSDPKWEGKFMIGALTWQTTRAILAGLFTRQIDETGEMTEEGWDWFAKFYANAVVFEEGMNRPEMIANGETPLSLNHFLGVQRDAETGGYNYAYIDTEGGTPIVVERNAILKGTDNMEQALAFLEYVQSVEFQVENAERFGVIPVHPDAIAQSPEDVRKSATLLTPQPIDWDLMARNLDGWLERIQLDLL
ncbi:extracellular solute-binding protein [Oricola sp.]|uniref:extracellular solute-binding protein n=1 Tax=Oricola sp. TaxID=1979950 RepID=UPI0025FD6A80|nr:extracellular solute-binding protein [Oricola sp.]MCI5077939.1 extracellular solute-binding protein [Oricola sp.]